MFKWESFKEGSFGRGRGGVGIIGEFIVLVWEGCEEDIVLEEGYILVMISSFREYRYIGY